jgi:hypothetical protein
MAEPSRARWIALAAVLAAIQAALLARTAWDKSDTIDEPHYLQAAISQWTRRDFSRYCDGPPLPRWAFALALRVVDPPLFDLDSRAGRHPLWSRAYGPMRRNLFVARLPTILVTVAGGLFLWAACRRFGEEAAALAHALWCVSPTVLANGALATLDAWAASLLAVALWAVERAHGRPTAGRWAVAGAALGLAAASKVTALGAVPVALAVAAHAVGGGARRSLRAGMAMAAGGALVVWACYAFSVGAVDLAHLCGRDTPLPAWRLRAVPAPAWLEGLAMQWLHGRKGHLGYLFGEVGTRGWWWFYLAALALKTTVGAQLLVLLRLASWLRARPTWTQLAVDAALLAYPVLLLVVMSAGRAQNGIKYLLPAFPLALAWLGRALPDAARAFGRRGAAAAFALALLAAAESLAVHPHHLMFFNAWAGGPDGGPRYLIVGDDWGQDQRRLGEWQRTRRPWRLFYTFYNGDPQHWTVTFLKPPCQPEPGFYALHAVEVHRPKRIARGCLDWLTVEPPDARLGHSIYLYQVTRARIERLLALRGRVTPFWASGGQGGSAPPPPDAADAPNEP